MGSKKDKNREILEKYKGKIQDCENGLNEVNFTVLKESDLLKKICVALQQSKKKKDIAMESLKNYEFIVPDVTDSDKKRIWILTGVKDKNDSREYVLNVGCSNDIKLELTQNVVCMYRLKEKQDEAILKSKKISKKRKQLYYALKCSYSALYLYEVDVDGFIQRYFNGLESSSIDNDFVKLVFDNAKAYWVEAVIAYCTGAMYWETSTSGIDYQAWTYLKSEANSLFSRESFKSKIEKS